MTVRAQLLPMTRQHNALPAAADQLPCSRSEQHLATRESGRPESVDDDAHILHPLPKNSQGIRQRSQDHYGGPMLVVMQDRDVQHFFQAALDLKAAGRADIFEIDPAETRR